MTHAQRVVAIPLLLAAALVPLGCASNITVSGAECDPAVGDAACDEERDAPLPVGRDVAAEGEGEPAEGEGEGDTGAEGEGEPAEGEGEGEGDVDAGEGEGEPAGEGEGEGEGEPAEGEGEGEPVAVDDVGDESGPASVTLDFEVTFDVENGAGVDRDCFAFTVPGPGTLTLATTDGAGGCPGDTEIDLLRAGALLQNDDDGGDDLCSVLVRSVTAGAHVACVFGTDYSGPPPDVLGVVLTASFVESGQTPALFFSEVADHIDGQVKYVELFNASSSPLTFSGDDVRIFNNGASTPNATAVLSGTIPANGAFVLAGSASAFSTLFGFAANQAFGGINGNGNDCYELRIDGVRVDVYGNVGVDGVGTTWDYADGFARRATSVVAGTTTFVAAGWTTTKAAATGYGPGAR